MAISAADVVSQYGSYYIANPKNQETLRDMIYKMAATAMYFEQRPTEDTVYRGTLATLDRVIQPFQKAFTPISTISFKPNQFDLFQLKIDLQETPDDLSKSYLGFLTSIDSQDRANWPFVRWWLEKHVMTKKDEDLEQNEYFAGVYAPPTPETAGAAGTAMNGLRKVIRGYNTDGRTNLGNGAITTGAAATANKDYCEQVETFVADIPTHFRKRVDFVFMSPENELKYKRGKRERYGKDTQYSTNNGVSGLVTIEDFPNASVVGLDSMIGSDMMFTTIKANRIRPMKKQALANSFDVKSYSPRVVSAYTDWWEALNFEVPEFIFHNDQDLS